ncbi:MAG: membrane protein YdbS with pleckstrin-like domain [Paraglaciecola sp.]|jgi:membrane protein YdbS with pleckstrin-like domain
MVTPPFSNSDFVSMPTESSPAIEQLTLHAISEKYAPLNAMINLVTTVLIILLAGLVYFQPWINLPVWLVSTLPLGIILVTVLGLVVSSLNYLADKRKYYALRQSDLHFQSGLVFCKTVSQPITRIQHVELKQGPLERAKGLASLQVFSAGGALHTFEIPGLEYQKAQQIRQFILRHKDITAHG